VTVQDAKTIEEAPSYNLDGLFIADWNGQPVGMVQALVDKFREEKKGFIQTLAVLPEFRRRGIAKKLLFEAISTLKRREWWPQAHGHRLISQSAHTCTRALASSLFERQA